MMKPEVICSITPLGNVGNQMIQMMVAMALEKYSGIPFVYNHKCDHFPCEFNEELHKEAIKSDSCIIFRDGDIEDIYLSAQKLKKFRLKYIVIDGYFQRYNLFLPKEYYLNFFGFDDKESDITLSNNEILINIRAGEICQGIWAYPLIPIQFYEFLIQKTGYAPVFVGQIDESEYVNELKKTFKNARFIHSGGPLIDMIRIRKASKICITVSTFSWINAWLSDAKEIYYPVIGILHPNSLNGYDKADVNLLPVGDDRYKYYLFPITRGEREDIYIEKINRSNLIPKEISADFIEFLSRNETIIPYDENGQYVDVDEHWYLNQYQSACWEISQCFYRNAKHHYNEIGKFQGNAPYRQIDMESLYGNFRDISNFGKTSQSSVCKYSRMDTTEEDSKNPVNGVEFNDYAFHTDFESHPWWKVEFDNIVKIRSVIIHNRGEHIFISQRLFPLSIEVSIDGKTFTEVATIFETTENMNVARTSNIFIADFPNCVPAKYLRIIIKKETEALHLKKITIYACQDPADQNAMPY